MKRRCRFVPLFLSVVALRAAAQTAALRPFAVEDLFQLGTLGEIRISPDGVSIAVVIQRKWSDPLIYRPFSMFGNDQADIWLLPAREGPARQITHGSATAAGFWNPIWSPDGQRLALLSTTGGDNVRAYVWESSTGNLTRVSDLGVDLSVTGASGQAGFDAAAYTGPIQWIDARRLLVALLPPGEQPAIFRMRRQTPAIASSAWQTAARGRAPTASVLDAGLPTVPDRPEGRVIEYDVSTRRSRIIATGHLRSVLLSPDRRSVALLTQDSRQMLPGQPLSDVYSAPSHIGIAPLGSSGSTRWIDSVQNPVVDIDGHPHRWSPDGRKLAVLSRGGGAVVISIADRSAQRVAGDLSATAVAWTKDGALLLRGRKQGDQRAEWWIADSAGGGSRRLTSGFATVPARLIRSARDGQMIALSDGALWTIDANTADVHKVHDLVGVSRIVWPSLVEREVQDVSTIVVQVNDTRGRRWIKVDLSAPPASFAIMPSPAPSAALADYSAERQVSVFAAPRDGAGTFVWTTVGAGGSPTQRLAFNTQMARIAGGTKQLVEYRSTRGEDLKGLLLLPVTYKQGTTYPLVVWVYPQVIIRDSTSADDWFDKNHAHQDNLNVLAGRGYAVLIPSMPDPPPGGTLTESVLPAVERIVALGIADSSHIGLMGQSGGGGLTLGIVTQTNRFKAAIDISGFSDRVSAYGTFSGETRYTNSVDDKLAPWGTAPWKDPDKVLTASPIAFIDRVETPVLLIHGDLDFVPVQQAEEAFTSLARLGKRVRFVRYWGESHGASDSPANLRDRWRQILSWFDTYLVR